MTLRIFSIIMFLGLLIAPSTFAHVKGKEGKRVNYNTDVDITGINCSGISATMELKNIGVFFTSHFDVGIYLTITNNSSSTKELTIITTFNKGMKGEGKQDETIKVKSGATVEEQASVFKLSKTTSARVDIVKCENI